MPKTVLQICQAAADLVPVKEPDTIINTTDANARTMRTVCEHAGLDLMRKRGPNGQSWDQLDKDLSISTLASQRVYVLPTDFVSINTMTVYDRQSYLPAYGPQTPSEWAIYQYGLGTPTTISLRYRIIAAANGRKAMELDPTPSEASDTLSFIYRSNAWLTGAGADMPGRSVIEADTDMPIFPSDLMELAVAWRFKKSTGLPFAAELGEYEALLGEILSDEFPQESLQMNSGPFSHSLFENFLDGLRVRSAQPVPITGPHTRLYAVSEDETLSEAEVSAGASSQNATITGPSWPDAALRYRFIGIPANSADITDIQQGGFSVFTSFERYTDQTNEFIIVAGHKWWKDTRPVLGEYNSDQTLTIFQ